MLPGEQLEINILSYVRHSSEVFSGFLQVEQRLRTIAIVNKIFGI